MSKLVLSMFAALVLSSNVLATQITNCKAYEETRLTQGVIHSKKQTEGLIKKIDFRLKNDRYRMSKYNYKKFVKAKYILKCARGKIDKLTFNCSNSIAENKFMTVLPIVGTEVQVNQYELSKASNFYVGAMILHEATHKCGTTDAATFYQNRVKPHSTWFSEWHNIASTYDYWALVKFCLPEVDC